MIKIIDDWYVEIESNPTNYILKRGGGERDATAQAPHLRFCALWKSPA